MREVESGGNSSHWVRKKMAAATHLLSAEEQLVEERSQ